MDLSKSDLKAIFKKLGDYLPEDEEIERVAVSRSGSNSLYLKPTFLASDYRVILVEPKFLGFQAKPRSLTYDQIADIHLEEGWFTSKISITPFPGNGAALVADYLEKRRSREFHQYILDRIQGNTPPDSTQRPPKKATAPTEADPVVEQLSRLKQLRDEGLITAEEYANKKREILDRL